MSNPVYRIAAVGRIVALGAEEVPETVDPSLIRLTFMCGNGFHVRNGGDE